MRVNINANLPVVSAYVRTAGYGATFHTDDLWEEPNREKVLHQVDVPVTSESDCVKAYHEGDEEFVNYEHQVCAGYMNRGGCDAW